MKEEIQNNPKLFISIIISGIIFIIILLIFSLVLIWSKNDDTNVVGGNEATSDNIETGKYVYKTTSEGQVVEKYCRDILDTFSMQDKDEIYNLILKEYSNYRGFNKDTLFDNLRKKGLIGKLLKFYSYQSVSHDRYGKVFEIEIGTYDSYVKEKILLIEASPRNYKVSFDGFIGEDNSKKEIIRDGLKMTITNVREFVSEMQIKITINNISSNDIVINKQGNYENIYLKLKNGSEVRMSSVWLSGVTKTLTSNSTINLDLQFNPEYLLTGAVNAIVIKDVYNDISRETKDLEFPI
ncbi:MAG: hypothetical protein K0R72_607 [Clostridia bacterium]|jgi:hypothetical protein|nr:hypothetical protein [Clostridia bacterium]